MALTLLAGLQLLAIGSILLIGAVRLPSLLGDVLARQFSEAGLDLQWEAASLDLTGACVFEGFVAREATTGNPVFRAREVRFDLDLTTIPFAGGLGIESVFVREAALYLPPELAGDGGGTPDLRVDEALLRRSWQRLELAYLHARLGEMRLFAHGPLPALEGTRADARERTLATAWRQGGARLLPWIERGRMVSAGEASIALGAGPDAGLRLALPSLDLQPAAPVRLEELLVRVNALDFSTRVWPDQTEAQARRLTIEHGGQRLTLEALRLRLQGPAGATLGDWELPSLLTAHARWARPLAAPVALTAELDLAEAAVSLQGFVRLAQGTSRIVLFPRLARADLSGVVELRWAGSPAPLLDSLPGAPTTAVEMAFSPHTRADGRLHFGDGMHFERGTVALQAHQFRVREAAFDEARLSAWFDRKQLQVGPIRAFDPDDQWAEGYYRQDFATGDYRILARGAVRPRRLDSLLPSFYRGLWKDIDPGPHPARADVDVRSRWGDPAASTALVHVRGSDLAYAGLPVAAMELHLWQAAGFVDLMDLETVSERGLLEGSVGLTFAPREEPARPRLQVLDLYTELPLEDLAVVFGEEVAAVAERVSFSVPPSIELTGMLTRRADQPAQRALELTVRSETPWTLDTVPFDRLFTRIQLRDETVRLDPWVASAGKGRWEVRGELAAAGTPTARADFVTSMEALPYAVFRGLLGQFDTPEVAQGQADGEDALENAGTVDLEFDGHFAGDPWSTLAGRGSLLMTRVDLGRVHVLGGFSRLFSSVGIHLTSLQLDRAQSALRLAEGRLYLPDLAFEGPSLRIEAPGDIGLADRALDFRARAFFLQGERARLGLLFSPLFSPLGHVFEMEVGGTFEDPEWRWVNNPLGFLRPDLPKIDLGDDGADRSLAPSSSGKAAWPRR